ncbi:MAG: competence protein ComEA [Acidobacteriota bacterium]|jgi:competence protein ComEA
MHRFAFTLTRTFAIAIVVSTALGITSAADVFAQSGKPAAAKAAPAPANAATPKASGRARTPSAARVRATPSAPVNLNAASIAQLQTLPGVGASTAQRILDYRQKNGAFKKVEELMNVKGVGEKSFLKLKPLITVGGERGTAPEGQK